MTTFTIESLSVWLVKIGQRHSREDFKEPYGDLEAIRRRKASNSCRYAVDQWAKSYLERVW